MVFNAYTVILTIILCQRSAAYYENEYSPNVGTVLFNEEDMTKPRWNKQDIGLLKARKYFQTLLPPPVFVNTFNEDYVDILLRYFKDAYATIKKEAFDTETDTIMTTALSDAIGGYLKVWVLPVAKLDYYGGTVSQDNVVKLFKFYNEIKRYLDTDGTGWRKPDEAVLNSLTINVAPLKPSNTRSNKENACDRLAYFEKTSDGLGVPIPYVNWNEKMSTMFIPLKNVSLVPMNDPDSAQNLIKYYDAARGCILSSNPKEQERFDERFQAWLASEVVPHLKDENLYLALGSVLSLVNRSRDPCNNVMDVYSNKYYATIKQPHSIPKIPVDFSSKKMWIISIILLIEIAWCIPALIYILCTKKVSKKDCSSNVYLFIDKPDRKDKGHFHKAAKQSHSKSNACSAIVNDSRPPAKGHSNPTKCGIKLYRKSRLGNMEFEAQYPSTLATHTTVTVGTTTHTDYSSKDRSASAIKTVSGTETTLPKKSSLKKSSSQNFTSESTRILTLSNQDAYNYEVKRGTTENVAIIQNSIKSIQSVEEKYEPKSRKDKLQKHSCEKDESKQQNHEKLCLESSSRRVEERRKHDERKKADEHHRAEDCRKEKEERQRPEECRRSMEERQRGEECHRQIEERQRSEECRRLKEERQRAEECRRQMEERQRAEECRRQLEERQRAEEYRRQIEERQRAEECRRQAEERQRAEECRRQMEERQRSEECRRQMEERQRSEECRRLEERQRSEECRRQVEERQRPEECRRPMEERQRAEECRRLEERQRAEECRRQMEERQRAEEARRQMEERHRAEECRRLEERQRVEECRRLEEQQKAEEIRRLEERRKVEEVRRLEERKKNEEIRRQADELKRLEERKKADDLKKAEERRKADELKRAEERRKADELKRAEERRKADELKKAEERRKADELKKAEERRKADELKRLEERKKADEYRKHEERRKAEEIKKQEERRRQEEIKKFEEHKNDNCCRNNDPPCCRNNDPPCCRNNDPPCCRREGDCCKREEDSSITGYSVQTNVVEIEKGDFRTEESEEYDTVNEMKAPTPQPCSACEDSICSCTGCMQSGCRKSIPPTDTESPISETDSKMSDKQVEVKSPRYRSEVRKSQERAVKINSGKPYLEITIDRPATEICVDVSRSMQKHSHKQLYTVHNQAYPQIHHSHKQIHSPRKPSKIPKLTSCNVIHSMAFDSRRCPSPIRSLSPSEKRKSMIPQRTKKAVDDIGLNPCHCGRVNKLNDTF